MSSSTSTTPSRTMLTFALAILVLVLDVACGVALFLLACLVAGFLRQLVPVDYPDLYGLWFALGLIPLVLFARWRGVVNQPGRRLFDIVPLLLVWPFLPHTLFSGPAGTLYYVIALATLIWLGTLLSRVVFKRESHSESQAG